MTKRNPKFEIHFDSSAYFEILTEEFRALVRGGGTSDTLSTTNTGCLPNILCSENVSCMDQVCGTINTICHDGQPKDICCSGPEGERNGLC